MKSMEIYEFWMKAIILTETKELEAIRNDPAEIEKGFAGPEFGTGGLRASSGQARTG